MIRWCWWGDQAYIGGGGIDVRPIGPKWAGQPSFPSIFPNPYPSSIACPSSIAVSATLPGAAGGAASVVSTALDSVLVGSS